MEKQKNITLPAVNLEHEVKDGILLENKKPFKESRMRSFLKGLSWRIVATSTLMTIVYVKTGSFQSAFEIGGVAFFIKFALYYGHERLWQLIPRGGIRRFVRRILKPLGIKV